jgi:hypothetical protein
MEMWLERAKGFAATPRLAKMGRLEVDAVKVADDGWALE